MVMRFKIGQSRTQRVKLPSLIGGINTGNDSSAVADNQLSDGVNVMAVDGNLRTRPAMVTGEKSSVVLQSNAKKIKHYDIKSGENTGLVSVWEEDGISFFYTKRNGALSSIGRIATDGEILNEWTVAANEGLYSFITYDTETGPKYEIYKNTGDSFDKLTDEDIYTPVVYENCRSDGSQIPEINGASLEGYNRLSNRYKIKWTAFNTLAKSGEAHQATYRLAHIPPVNSVVKVEILHDDGNTVTHDVVIKQNNDWSAEEKAGEDGLLVKVLYDRIWLYNGSDAKIWVCSAIPEGVTDKSGYWVCNVKNGITVTASYEREADEGKEIFSATCHEWYGGYKGVAGGTRLFIGGMSGKCKNLLQWSDLNNPLYFPADCNAQVGRNDSAITCFGKQGDMLVIFKENDIYYSNYTAGDSEGIDSELGADLTVATAIFTIVQIPSEAGCDCPDTVRLCRNRLVWANSNGKVYTLVNSSQYNEKNIYEVSGPINAILNCFTDEDIKGASAGEYGGYYVLNIREHILIMDYNSYGYSYIYSYRNEEAAESKLPWFYLKAPVPFEICIDLGGIAVTGEKGICYYYADESRFKDIKGEYTDTFVFTEQSIYTMLQSKVFDFSYPEVNKRICQLYAEIGNTEGDPVLISYVTDRSRLSERVGEIEYNSDNIVLRLSSEISGERSKYVNPRMGYREIELKLTGGNDKEYSTFVQLNGVSTSAPGYLNMVHLNPQLNFVKKFAVRMECEGVFSLGSVSINYKMLGSVK